ncbi:sensor histidine kinase [Brevibacillus ruminantium]|uniref:histidine kinase n=1 Tax=Brevibacillus ruminantium TaxID=2950604 RepID=A0ABY4W8U6_9BACL|nr:sensor histidine kinase [Brevibacillus ruminantium]USG63339.1 sensor histidine kinase [Brevibacillus ruminantium]
MLIRQFWEVVKQRFFTIWFFALIVLILIPNSYMHETSLQFAFSLLILFCHFFLFWSPKRFWNPLRVELAAILLGLVTILKGIIGGAESLGLMFPLAIFLGGRLEDRRALIYGTGLGLICLFLIIISPSTEWAHILSFVLTYVGCFVGAKGYRMQYEAFHQNQIHLEQSQKTLAQLKEAHDELQEAAVHTMQLAVLEERTRIARDLHDQLGHSLTSLIVQLHALKFMLKNGPQDAQEAVQNMLFVAKHSLEDIRGSVHTLATDQTSLGLAPLRAFLSQTEKNTGLHCELIAEDPELVLTQSISISFYRILQEAVTNTLRHSDASELQVIVAQSDTHFILTIRDNGGLTNQSSVTPGFGLTSMKDRVTELKGVFTYSVLAPHGFEIHVSIPYQDHA